MLPNKRVQPTAISLILRRRTRFTSKSVRAAADARSLGGVSATE